MPANKKYLNTSGWSRFSRIMAGFLGGLLLTLSCHMVLTLFLEKPNVLITMSYFGFILWAVLFIVAFLARKTWWIWSIYLGLTAVFSLILLIA